jgi:hypothetical protein
MQTSPIGTKIRKEVLHKAALKLPKYSWRSIQFTCGLFVRTAEFHYGITETSIFALYKLRFAFGINYGGTSDSANNKYKICPTNELYFNVFTLEYVQYLYISRTCFDPVGSSSRTHSKLKNFNF